jgi:hypothetical protein
VTDNRHMLTRDQLADMLRTVNVEALAAASGVSVKTIYRLRHKQHSPNLETVGLLLPAIERLQKADKAAA